MSTNLDEAYYGNARREVQSLLPNRTIDSVLEIGCGTGSTLVWLKERIGCTWIGGVELFPEAAAKARGRLDLLVEGNIEQMDLPVQENSLDLILCLDVLEHLVDPWQVAQRLQKLLKPGGALIICVPNVQCKRVIFPLLFKGKWAYTDSGIMDRTHLRFFTRSSAIQMLESSGLHVDAIDTTGGFSRGWKGPIMKKLLPEGIKSFFVLQYLMRGIKPSPGSSRPDRIRNV